MADEARIYQIEAVPVGNLFIMPCPRTDSLKEDVAYYQSLGVHAVLSLLKQPEADRLGLATEAKECAANGLDFLSFPIADFTVPERGAFLALIDGLAMRLQGGQGLAVHCRAGIGRSGMVVCCLLGRLGVPDVIAAASRARGVDVPDTAEQRAFIESVLAGFA